MSSSEHKNVGKNTEFREKQKAMLTGDYAESTKTAKLEQPSKNVGCPVNFAFEKILSFPEHIT